MKTIVVNAFGGPGTGKTTAAWTICSELKKAGILAEYVSEYAKELVYDLNSPRRSISEYAKSILNGSLYGQKVLFAEQTHRVERLMGQVQVVVTDSPIMLSAIYLKEPNQKFEDSVIRQFWNYPSFNFVIDRDKDPHAYQESGRLQTLDEAIEKDKEITNMLHKYGIPYEVYTHESIPKLITTLKELTRSFESANTEKDIEALEDSLEGAMIRKDHHKAQIRVLDNNIQEIRQDIENIKNSEYDLE